MENEKKQQAKHLFLQSELTKSQIAGLLNVSRRSLSYWVKEGDWQRLKDSATHLPAILAENCYHIFGHSPSDCCQSVASPIQLPQQK
jgi:hypothetical protein